MIKGIQEIESLSQVYNFVQVMRYNNNLRQNKRRAKGNESCTSKTSQVIKGLYSQIAWI